METGECGYGGQVFGGSMGVTIFEKPNETVDSPKLNPGKAGSRNDDGPIGTISDQAQQGDINAIMDLVMPTHFGWRLQIEFSF